MYINGLRFEQTCSACPEQYNVFINEDVAIGYVRLQWGYLRADYIHEKYDITVYSSVIGDGYMDGMFTSEEERQHHLNKISKALIKKHEKEQKEKEFE